ncbi:MAG: AI-2E family transporter [Cyclonatronaceae bacterium]
MSESPPQPTVELPWYARMASVLLLLTLIIYGMIVAKSLLIPLLFALFFAVLLSPLAGKLESWYFPRTLSSIISLLLGLSIFVGISLFFYSQIIGFVDEVDMVERRLRALAERLDESISPYTDIDLGQSLQELPNMVITYISDNFQSLGMGVLSAASTLTSVFIVPVYVILILIFRTFLKEFAIRAFSNGNDQQMEKLLLRIKSVVQNYILGMFMVICILAVLNSSMLLLLGVENALFFGVFAAVLNIVPFVGPMLGSILPILYAWITMESLLIPLLVLIGFYIIQLFEGNLFTPGIVGRQVSLNPLITLLALFVGAQIWGLAGMILFIPASAVLKVIFDEVESLKPYGFLLGKADASHSRARSKLARRVQEISKQISEDPSDRAQKESSPKKPSHNDDSSSPASSASKTQKSEKQVSQQE